jgi:MFS family permease
MLIPPLAFGLVVSSLIVDVVPALLDRGVGADTAAIVASLYGVSTVLGRLGGGWLLDRFPAARVGVGVFAIGAIGTLAFQVDITAGVVFAVIAAGLVNGAEIDIMSYMTIRYFGLGHYGRIFGTAYSMFMSAAVVGPLLTASLMQREDHALLFLIASGIFAFSALVLLALACIEGEPFDPASQHY